jgi:hypothetical protein
MKWIVELEPGTCWIAPWSGDPGRTAIKNSAKQYPSIISATFALARARDYSEFRDAMCKPAEEKP